MDNVADIGEKEIYNIGFSEKTIESILEKNIYNLTEEYLWNMYADFVREYSYFVYAVSYKYFDKYKNIANEKEKCRKWLNIVMELVGKPIPTDPYEQLYEVIAKFYDEWKNNPRAIVFKSKLREADRMLNKHLISLVVYETHYGDIDSNSCIIRLNTYDASKDFCVKNEKFAIGSDHKRQIIPDNICMLCEAVRRRIKEKFIPVTVDIINEGGILYVTKIKPYIEMVADLQDD